MLFFCCKLPSYYLFSYICRRYNERITEELQIALSLSYAWKGSSNALLSCLRNIFLRIAVSAFQSTREQCGSNSAKGLNQELYQLKINQK